MQHVAEASGAKSQDAGRAPVGTVAVAEVVVTAVTK
jgi:hypothetical protein